MKKKILVLGSAALLTATLFAMNSCSSIPNRANPIQKFDKEKYLGKWYEIARLDFADPSAVLSPETGWPILKPATKNRIATTAIAATGLIHLVFIGKFYLLTSCL